MVRREELTDEAWERIAPLLPENGRRGKQRKDHREVVNGILWTRPPAATGSSGASVRRCRSLASRDTAMRRKLYGEGQEEEVLLEAAIGWGGARVSRLVSRYRFTEGWLPPCRTWRARAGRGAAEGVRTGRCSRRRVA